MRRHLVSVCIVGILAFGPSLTGCEDHKQTVQDQPGGVLSPEAPPAPPVAPPTVATSASPGPLAAGPIDATHLDDAQTLAVLAAVNTGAVEEARVAATHASSTDVKSFAAQVAKTHQAMIDRDTQNRPRHNVTPVDSVASDQLQSDVSTDLTTLLKLPPPRFDSAYVDDQVTAGRQTLAIIDQAMPNLRDAWLRDDLSRDREQFKSELTDALRLKDHLEPGVTNMQGTGTPAWPSPPPSPPLRIPGPRR